MSLGFEPSRTVVLSFGFDEEASGLFVCPFKTRPFQGSKHQACKGAFELNKYLVAAFGQDSFAMLVDEGGMYIYLLLFASRSHERHPDGFSEQFGTPFAIPAIGEKGYFDTRLEVTTPGGHSSIPPEHTVSFPLCISPTEAYNHSLQEYWNSRYSPSSIRVKPFQTNHRTRQPCLWHDAMHVCARLADG